MIVRTKFPIDTWRFYHDPLLNRWETYRTSSNWPAGLLDWLYTTYGPPDVRKWDYTVNGWIYFFDEECVTMFMLKWGG